MLPPDLPADATTADLDGPEDIVVLWREELERAQKSRQDWVTRAERIVKRYRAEDSKTRLKKARYNVMWSNVQTMGPALYAKPPKPVVQRSFRDRDPIGRTASRILERVLQYLIEAGGLHETIELCVFDKLVPGRGQVWLRYEPTIEGKPLPEDTGGEGQTADDAEVAELERITDEMVHVDYVHWKDFLHEPARVWSEVSWVSRDVYLNRQQLVDRFGEEIGKAIPLNYGSDRQDDGHAKVGKDDGNRKAKVTEIWNKAKKEVLWLAEEFDRVCDLKEDPYHLKDFFPCPRPLFASVTTDSLVPVPDSEQYRPQAEELDLLTARIERVVDAIKVRGAYNLGFPELATILKGDENDMVPVAEWDQFAGATGLKGAMDFVPIELFIKVLDGLYKARQEVKSEIYEISGLSDILRGQGDASETATGVQAKGRFASLRLKSQQDKVARFVRDIVRLMAEMVCELFQPETLAEMAACQEMEDLQIDVPMGPPPGMMPPGPPQPALAPPGPPAAPMPPQRLPMGAA